MAPPSFLLTLLLSAHVFPTVLSRDIPSTLKEFYDSVRAREQCDNVLAGGFHSLDGDSGDFDYCGDYLDDYKIIYIQGKNGELSNMDVDCDGVQGGPSDDGRCGSSSDTQSITSFQEDVTEFGYGLRDLDANVHPYIVFGNEGTKPGWPTFDPTEHGVEPLSVMAVICNNKLIYGIWGETNGDDGSESMVGEASISIATACFGDSINGNSGHDENDVLYIAFTGQDAVPGAQGADWNATTPTDFETSISALGDKLIERIGSGCEGRAQAGTMLMYAIFAVGTVAFLL